MAREILFKAKRIDNGEWVYGNYAFEDTKGERHFIFQNFGFEYEVGKDTICQYTGLTDKNGNKIWENDVVRYTDDLVGRIKKDLVVWNGVHCAFARKSKCNYGLGFQYLWISQKVSEECEVIGNIFDNPELLGGADNG